LRELGAIASPEPVQDDSPSVPILLRYTEYLLVERAVVRATVDCYVPFARDFLTQRFGDKPLDLRALRESDVTEFVLRWIRSHSPGRARLLVTALRSFFRFLLEHGEIDLDLAATVPTVADWRLSTVPKYLAKDEVQRLLDACDRGNATGRRDYALLLLLARLGLRAGEVVALELDDIDWRAGEVNVHGKGARHDRLPLPPDVGEALAEYLRQDRPSCTTRRLFVRVRAPHRGFTSSGAIVSIVRRALRRADLDPPVKGAHLLRHSLATGMLRAGASLAEIGQVLRHRSPNTTEIYAKVDFDALRGLAQPWPIVEGGR
jgi:site-specific recombinase XerD